jgi:RIO kinase 1
MVSAALAELSFPGQFDDAEDDGDFVEMMQRRLDVRTEKNAKNLGVDEEYLDEDEEDDFEDDMYDDLEEELTGGGALPSSMSGSGTGFSGAAAKMNLSHSVSNSVTKMEQMETSKRASHTGRDDRATSEQCLDPRTRLLLFRMLSTGFLQLIDGCLSTGKEANVYYAKAGRSAQPAQQRGPAIPSEANQVTEYAIKIYKTSILVFKDRDKYVSGEHRWRKGYCK